MKSGDNAGAGRPLRALGLLALALWLAVRLPHLFAAAGAAMLAMQGPPPQRPGGAPAPAQMLALAVTPATARPARTLPRTASEASRFAPSPAVAAATPLAVAAGVAIGVVAGVAVEVAAKTEPPAPLAPSGFDLATSAYAQLAAGDRRAAAALFDAAIAAGPDPRVAAWKRERGRLHRRWSGDAYVLWRDAGPTGPAASPILGGGQSGGSLAWTLDPLARKSLAIVGRINAANDDPESAQAAIGLRWRPLPGVSVSAERLVAIGAAARDDWTLRLAAGAQGHRGRARWSGYGEAGVLGNGDVYAGGQTRAGVGVRIGPVDLGAGPGGWASLQTGAVTSGRVDIGPTVWARLPMGLELSADWRFRVAGNAAPGSGPAATLSAGF